MAAPDLVNLSGLMDDAKCFAFVRQHCQSASNFDPGSASNRDPVLFACAGSP